MINNHENMMPAAHNNENIEILKKLGIEFYTDNNGAVQSRRSKVINPEKLFTDPELLKRFKGGWFISDPSGTQWFYIKISNGRIIDLIPITSVAIKRISPINYCGGKFDFIILDYSTKTAHTDPQSAVVHYNNYSPKRINNEFKGLPYISEEGEKLKGALLYYLVSQHLKNSPPQNIIHIGGKQGWWITPLKKYKFNPSANYRKKILENLPSEVRNRENPIQGTNPPQDITQEIKPQFEDKPPFQVAILFRMASMFSTFFAHYGVTSDQIIVAHPSKNDSVELYCALFKNVSYDDLSCPPLGPNIKPLKNDIRSINDGVVLSVDSFAADQYHKIEKGIDCYINDINGAREENNSVNHIPVIISSFSDLHIPQNKCCVLNFDDFKTEYDAIQYRNTLRKLDASLLFKAENDFDNFINTFPMLFMLGHNVIVFDVSGTYTKEKILKRKMLPVDFVEHGIKFINVGEKVGEIPINPLLLNGFTSTQELFMYIHSIIRSCTGKLNDRQEKKLTSFIYEYIQANIVSPKVYNDPFDDESTEGYNNVSTDFKEIDIFEMCEWLRKCGAICRHIAEVVLSIIHNIKAIGYKKKTWEELFEENNKVIIINLGNEAGQRTHQLLDILVGSLLHWQMSCDYKFLSIAIDELKDQDFTLGSALNTIVTEGRKFHTALIGATQDYFNQGSSYLDSMKQANIKSYCRPGKSEDRVAQKLGYSNASTAYYKGTSG